MSSYMAEATPSASEYDGSGENWFKIGEIGPTFSDGSATWDMSGRILKESIYVTEDFQN